jgi:hypothetical protein
LMQQESRLSNLKLNPLSSCLNNKSTNLVCVDRHQMLAQISSKNAQFWFEQRWGNSYVIPRRSYFLELTHVLT